MTEERCARYMFACAILWFIGGVVLMVVCAGCTPNSQDTRTEASRISGPLSQCVTENGKYSHVTFCLNGNKLTICTADSGCLVVRVSDEE